MNHIYKSFKIITPIFLIKINNDGPWKAPHVEVDIDWPHQVGNDKPLGKWLLYLEEKPSVESTSGGECTISENLVNPLNLKAHAEAASLTAPVMLQDPAFIKRSNKSHTFAMEYREKSSSSFSSNEKKSSSDEILLNRVRRDRSMIIRADKLVDVDGKKTNTVTMVNSDIIIVSKILIKFILGLQSKNS